MTWSAAAALIAAAGAILVGLLNWQRQRRSDTRAEDRAEDQASADLQRAEREALSGLIGDLRQELSDSRRMRLEDRHEFEVELDTARKERFQLRMALRRLEDCEDRLARAQKAA